jgi:hypothetical protein
MVEITSPVWKYSSAISLFFIVACNNDINNNIPIPVKDTVSINQNRLSVPVLNNDTLFVHEQAAVFVIPDSIRIAKRKKEIGEENFQIGADDYAFYLNEAGVFLDNVKMKTFDTKDEKFIKFIGTDKPDEIIEINKLPELWSIYFFDPAKKSKQADMTIIEEEYKKYFTNKLK